MIAEILTAIALATGALGASDGWVAYVEPPPRTDIIQRIAECESGDTPTAKNPTSSASGTWQFIDSTFEWVTGLPAPARAYPLFIQRQAFDALWDDGRGASHWEASRHCWGKP